jgi:hypothetical protein
MEKMMSRKSDDSRPSRRSPYYDRKPSEADASRTEAPSFDNDPVLRSLAKDAGIKDDRSERPRAARPARFERDGERPRKPFREGGDDRPRKPFRGKDERPTRVFEENGEVNPFRKPEAEGAFSPRLDATRPRFERDGEKPRFGAKWWPRRQPRAA